MKNLFKTVLAALLLVVVIVPIACTKSGSNNGNVPLPDITDFNIVSAQPFVVGGPSTVYVSSSTLGSGTYSIHYSLSGSNTLSSQTSTLLMNGPNGSFKTSNLPAAGVTFLTLNSITNINGAGTLFTVNNTYRINDSTGTMLATIAGITPFKANDLTASISSGKRLTITGVTAQPSSASITLYIDNFNPDTFENTYTNFNSHQVPEVASAIISSTAIAGGGTLSANGFIKIVTSSGALLSGTFEFTGMDSTKITTGSFTLPSPSY